MEILNRPLRLSIIVAIYNVEAYLERCISSLVKQDLSPEEYEILLVNDGSTDGSLAICNRFAAEYNNITVYTKENGGLSSVRNFGIDHAKGRYIMHVDGDDYVEIKMVGKVLVKAEEDNLDLCFFQYSYYSGGKPIDNFSKFPHYKVFTGEELLLKGMKVSSTWCAIYRHSFLDELGIRFYGRISHQDVEYNYRLYPFAKRVMFTDYYVYNYFVGGESISRTKDINKKKKNLLDNLTIVHNVKEFAVGKSCPPKVKDLILKKMNSTVVAFLLSFLRKDCEFNYSFSKEFLCEAKRLDVYPVRGKTMSKKTARIRYLINIKWLYLLAVKIINRNR